MEFDNEMTSMLQGINVLNTQLYDLIQLKCLTAFTITKEVDGLKYHFVSIHCLSFCKCTINIFKKSTIDFNVPY